MTKEQFNKLHLNQRVVRRWVDSALKTQELFGYVTKLYNGNNQCQVWFDSRPKPVVVGRTQIEIIE